tara:strand:+ start:68 stop:499 length:432 start_codon:yes stop_codon:yes gene_type:complete
MVIKPYIIERGLKMTLVKVDKKKLATYAFEGCVQTLVGAFSTFNLKATPKEVEAYKREVEAFTIDEMNVAVLPMGLKVKVRKNLNYMKLPKVAQKLYDMIKSNCDVWECKDGTKLEIGVYIKTPTSKKIKYIPYKKGRTLDKN